jgi:hypothetical protein
LVGKLINQDRYIIFSLLEKFEEKNEKLKMIGYNFLLKCYNGRYYVDWSVVNYSNIDHFKSKFRTWWDRVRDNSSSNFMTKIVPVKGYSSYNLNKIYTDDKNNNGGNKVNNKIVDSDIEINAGNSNDGKKFIDLELPQPRMKAILDNNGSMILQILELKRSIKKVNRNKMPLGWKMLKQRRQYGISKGHEEIIFVGPNGEKSNSTSGMLRIIKRSGAATAASNNNNKTNAAAAATAATTSNSSENNDVSYFNTKEMLESIKAEDEVAILMKKLENDLALMAKLSDAPLILDLKSIDFDKLWGNVEDLPLSLRNKFGRHLLSDKDYVNMWDKTKQIIRYSEKFVPTNGDYVLCGSSNGGIKGYLLVKDEDDSRDEYSHKDEDIVAIQLDYGMCYAHINNLIVLEKVSPRPTERVNVQFGKSIFRGQVISYRYEDKMYVVRVSDLKLAHESYTTIYCKKEHFVMKETTVTDNDNENDESRYTSMKRKSNNHHGLPRSNKKHRKSLVNNAPSNVYREAADWKGRCSQCKRGGKGRKYCRTIRTHTAPDWQIDENGAYRLKGAEYDAYMEEAGY